MAGFFGKVFFGHQDVSLDVKLGVLESVEMAQESFHTHFPAAQYLFSTVLNNCVIEINDLQTGDEDKRRRFENCIIEERTMSLRSTQGLDLAAMKLVLLYLREKKSLSADSKVLLKFTSIFSRAAKSCIRYRDLKAEDSLPPSNARTARVLKKAGFSTLSEMFDWGERQRTEQGTRRDTSTAANYRVLALFDIDDELRNGAQYGPIKILQEALDIESPQNWGKPFSYLDHVATHLVGK